MKGRILFLATLMSTSAFACNFQGEANPIVKSKKISCNEEAKIATIKNPQIEIDGKFYNLGAGYSQNQEYWDTETHTSNYETPNREVVTVTTESEKKTRKIGIFLSMEARNRICELFGFSRSIEASYSNFFIYLKKAYWLDDGKLYPQSPNYMPLEEIKCN